MRALLFNIPDANGIVTEYEYNADGLVTSVTRKDGAETLASVSVAYDESARPVSVRDQDGRVTAFDRDAFGRVLKEKFADGSEVAYTYDAFGSSVKYAYDAKGHLTSQTVNGELIEYAYTRRGQLAGKYLGGKLNPDAAVEYEYAKDGQIVARTANGVRQTYEYDFKGQLLGVKEGEEYVERYAYDRAGNMVKKVVRGSRFVVRDGVECVTRDGELSGFMIG